MLHRIINRNMRIVGVFVKLINSVSQVSLFESEIEQPPSTQRFQLCVTSPSGTTAPARGSDMILDWNFFILSAHSVNNLLLTRLMAAVYPSRNVFFASPERPVHQRASLGTAALTDPCPFDP
jgi:hypothetical protein